MKRILWLSNSEDVGPAVPEELRSWSLAAARLQAELAEDIEVVTRVIWPDPRLPDLIGSWMERYEPDLVMFRVNAYWYLYRSVPLRLRRRFGRPGRGLAAAGERAGSARFARTRLFHWLRAGALKAIGGDSFFEVDEVAAMTEECVRRIQRDESIRVVVNTTLDHWTSNPRRQAQLHRRLKAFCESRHAVYLGADPERDPPPPDLYGTGDRLHTDAAGHAWLAERQAAALVEAFRPELALSPAWSTRTSHSA